MGLEGNRLLKKEMEKKELFLPGAKYGRRLRPGETPYSDRKRQTRYSKTVDEDDGVVESKTLFAIDDSWQISTQSESFQTDELTFDS